MLFKDNNTVRQLISASTALFLIICSIFFYPRNVYGFMPYTSYVLFLSPTSSSHEGITRLTVIDYDRTLFGTSQLTPSMKKAIQELVDHNARVDNRFAPTFGLSANHVDGENFTGAHTRLVEFVV